MTIGLYDPPAFCHSCGKPFPWTERKVQAAIELFVDEVGKGTDQAKEFEQSIHDIVRDTPMAQVAASRITVSLKKLPGHAAEVIRGLVVEVAAEGIKKLIWPGL